MPLPDNFSPFEHLQDMIRREHNKTVRRFFKDLGNETWDPEIKSPRGALRVACTIDDNDTATMTLIRLYLFYEVLGYGKKRLARVYGVPDTRFEEDVTTRPQIFLYFSQDGSAVPDGADKVDMECSFRLMDETSSTITPAKVLPLARKIKELFLDANKGIVHGKGKFIVYYRDKELGYDLRIRSINENEGVELIKKILSIRNHTYDSNKKTLSTPTKNSVNTQTATSTVYGKQRKSKRWRPTANVRFRYAYLHVDGLRDDVYLVDTTSQNAAIA
jgi:hypothetical protein